MWAWDLRVNIRPQVPKYLRESQQLLRCVMRAHSDTTQERTPMRPEWDLQAVTMNGEWIIAIGDHDGNQLAKDIAVRFSNPDHMQHFKERLTELWRTRGGKRQERDSGPAAQGDSDPRINLPHEGRP
eukprot:725124-Alexandrium_andersonii.AAC.1